MFQDYLAGFFDGEGSLIIRFKSDIRYKSGFQIKPNIDITQKHFGVLKFIKDELKMGKIYFNKQEQLWHYDIYKFEDLLKFVLILKGRLVVKKEKLESFEKCLSIIIKKEHLTKEGLEKIKKIWLNPKTEANTP